MVLERRNSYSRRNAEWNERKSCWKTEAEDIIWWKMDEHHHQSIIIFPSEDVAKAEFEKRQEMRNKTTSENNMKMVEEIMGPILSQLSNL